MRLGSGAFRGLALLALGILPCRGGDGLLAIPEVLYTTFEVEPPAPVMEAIRKELAAIMLPVGIRLEWRPLSRQEDYTPAVDLTVIDFKGRCDTSGMTAFSQKFGVLGLTHTSDGEILPFAEIDCDRIRSFLQRDLSREPANERERLFGRAIARVVSHELYHIFADTLKHGSCGIGKSNFIATDLLSGDLHFEQREVITLRKGKTMANLENAANASIGTPRESAPVDSSDVLKHTAR